MKEVLRSRYHMDYPIAAKNPLTNLIIIDSVNFYLIPIAELISKITNKHPTSIININAHFIGTDYTYAYCQDFRE